MLCLLDSLIYCFVGNGDLNDYTSEEAYIPKHRASEVEKRIIKDG